MSTNPNLLEHTDQLVVAKSMAEVEGYLAGGDPEWEAAHADATCYINSLYDEFSPTMSEGARQAGLRIGSIGLALAAVRYGADENAPRLYGGAVEGPVLATYHHGAHSRRFLRSMFEYAKTVNTMQPGKYGEAEFARFPAIASLHDIIMGNGRGTDERQSRLFSVELGRFLGVAPEEDAPTSAAIDATTWSDELQAQSVDPTKPHLQYQRAAGVADLSNVFTRRGLREAICLSIEDLCKNAHGKLFVREAAARGFSLVDTSIDECMEFVDSSEALKDKYGQVLADQAHFFESFKPADPNLDQIFPGRTANIALAREVSRAYQAPRSIGAVGSLAVAREFEKIG